MHNPHNFLQRPQWILLPLAGTATTELQQKPIVLSRYIQQYPHVSWGQVAAQPQDNALSQQAIQQNDREGKRRQNQLRRHKQQISK